MSRLTRILLMTGIHIIISTTFWLFGYMHGSRRSETEMIERAQATGIWWQRELAVCNQSLDRAWQAQVDTRKIIDLHMLRSHGQKLP